MNHVSVTVRLMIAVKSKRVSAVKTAAAAAKAVARLD